MFQFGGAWSFVLGENPLVATGLDRHEKLTRHVAFYSYRSSWKTKFLIYMIKPFGQTYQEAAYEFSSQKCHGAFRMKWNFTAKSSCTERKYCEECNAQETQINCK